MIYLIAFSFFFFPDISPGLNKRLLFLLTVLLRRKECGIEDDGCILDTGVSVLPVNVCEMMRQFPPFLLGFSCN